MTAPAEPADDLPPEGLPAEVSDLLTRDPAGLVPAIVQDHTTGRVLMMAWVNDEALAHTLRTRQATFWSRSRRELWTKGATSGNTQHVRSIEVDCDGDTLLFRVDAAGPACHTGLTSCFDTRTLLADDSSEAHA